MFGFGAPKRKDKTKEAQPQPRSPKQTKQVKQSGRKGVLQPGRRAVFRRTEEEVRHLVVIFKQAIEASSSIKERISQFWPTEDLLSELLFALARDVPNDSDPLQVDAIDLEDFSAVMADAASHPDDTAEVFQEKIKIRAAKFRCVEWIGLVNTYTGTAAVKVQLPGRAIVRHYTSQRKAVTYSDLRNVLCYTFLLQRHTSHGSHTLAA